MTDTSPPQSEQADTAESVSSSTVEAAKPAFSKEQCDFDAMRLQVGARLQFLFAQADKRYPLFSTLIGYVPNEYLICKLPLDKERGGFFPFHEGDRLQVRVFSGIQVFTFTAYVDRVFAANLNYVHLSFPRAIEAVRLRSSVRVQVDLAAEVRRGGADACPAVLANVSVDGARLRCKQPLGEVGGEFALQFSVVVQPGDHKGRIECGAVIRSIGKEAADGAMVYGVKFGELDSTQRLLLQNFIYQTQIEDRRKVV